MELTASLLYSAHLLLEFIIHALKKCTNQLDHVHFWLGSLIINYIYIYTLFFFLEMICPQHFYNIFTTNSKWRVVTGCYYWVKKVISVLNSNLNQ